MPALRTFCVASLLLTIFFTVESSLISIKDDECPCVKPTGSSSCIAYDSRYQASSLDEAMSNFFDLRSLDPLTAKLIIPGKTVANTLSESTNSILSCGDDDECRSCMGQFLDELSNSQNASDFGDTFKSHLSGMKLRFGAYFHHSDRKDCNWMGKHADLDSIVKQPLDSDKLKQLTDLLQGNGQKTDAGRPFHRQKGGRQKRQDSSYYKTQTVIDCRQRGAPVEDGSQWLGLCSNCWKWGVLKDQYFPAYVNLMTCDTDNRCLGGYGQCNQRYKSLTVLQQSSSGSWDSVSLSVPYACDCQVKYDSSLASLAQS